MTTPDRGQPPDGVQLRLVGTFAVACGGTPVAGPDLGSRKARTLLKLLAVERPRTVTAARIAEVLWGAAQPAGPAENIATFVSRLRRILGADVILGGRPGYRLGPPPAVQVDLDEAGRWADEAERRLATAEPALAVAAATRGLDVLAAGLVLEDEPDAEWAQPARAEQAELLRRVRHVLAEAALAAGDPSAAAAAAVAAVSDDPYDERARRALMRGLAAGGEPARALATYAELRDLLAEELGADPAAQTQQLHLAVLREQELPPGDAALPGGAAPGNTAPRGRAVPLDLPGRGAELNRLRAAWNDAAAGHPALLLVSGEAGIGKTRLAGQLTRIAATTGGTVLAARCYETERSLFLQPFADAIATVVRAMPPARMQDLAGGHAPVLARLVPEVAELLGPLPAARQDTADIERRRGFEAVTAFIRALADRGPVLLSLDDLQNAGRATVELLHYLARHAPRSQLLVIATVRAEEGAEVADSLGAVSVRMDLGPPGRRTRPNPSSAAPAGTRCSWSRRCARSRPETPECRNRWRKPSWPGYGGPARPSRRRCGPPRCWGHRSIRLRWPACWGRPRRPRSPRARARWRPGCSWWPIGTTSSPTTWSVRCSTRRPRRRPGRCITATQLTC
jgi:DNA-binding SARP family transcriptional activator